MAVLGEYFNRFFGVPGLRGACLQDYENGYLTRDTVCQYASVSFEKLLRNIILHLEESRLSEIRMTRSVAQDPSRINLYCFFAKTIGCWKSFIEENIPGCDSDKLLKLGRWSKFIPSKSRASVVFELVSACLEKDFYRPADCIIDKNKECILQKENIEQFQSFLSVKVFDADEKKLKILEKWSELIPDETKYKVLIALIRRYLKLKDYSNALRIVEENTRSFKVNSTELRDFIQIETLLANEDEFRVLEELSKCLPVAFRYCVFVYFIRKCLREKPYKRLISLLKSNNDKKFVEFIHENKEKSKDLNTNLFYVIEAAFENFKKESDALEIIDLCCKFPCFSDEDLERINSWKKIVRTRFSS